MSDGLPETMHCVEIAGKGGPDMLRLATRPVPHPGPREVLIAVDTAGVNRPDVLQREGRYPAPPGASDLPGLEVSGVIAALGPDCGTLAVGMPVCALLSGGGYAEYVVAEAPLCLPVPRGLSLTQAGALPETVFTVWHNVFERAQLAPGESFLVHGGSSGIGTIAIQMAKARGARVFTTAGSKTKCDACVALGADRAINYREETYEDVIRATTEGRGVDVILDMVGGDYVARDIGIMADDGRRVSIAFLNGSRVSFDMMRVMLKRLVLTGSTLRARPVAVKAAIAAAVREHVWPLLESGRVYPPIHAEFPLDQAVAAHRLMEDSSHIGKIVLAVKKSA
ncbi:NAD(P)H-quinone oxidoreductase [Pararhodospirillum photometricum]|nr:NAD(P)H-quinone oxidoreductase [Pararhodospirillum photometricum]